MKKLMNNQRGFIPLIVALAIAILTTVVLVYMRVQKVNK